MSSLRALVLVLCTSWCLLEETSAWNKYSCGATDFILDEIDKVHKEIKFKWRGFNGYHEGETYSLKCDIYERYFDRYTQFSCKNADVLPKNNGTYYYDISDQDYFCAVTSSNFERSKVLKVRTPGNSRPVTPDILAIALPIVILIIIVVCIIKVCCWCKRRRRTSVVELVVQQPETSNQQPATTVNNNINIQTNPIPPCSYPVQHPPVQHPPPCFYPVQHQTSEGPLPSAPQQPYIQQNYYPNPNQWGNPPPYNVANDNQSFPKTFP